MGQLSVGITVADDITVREVVLGVVHVFLEHASSGLAHGGIVLREMVVDVLGVKCNALASQRVEDEIVDRPEGIFRK